MVSEKCQQKIENLISGPQFPEKAFIVSGTTYGELYDLAADLRQAISGYRRKGALCLCAENKSLVAATILAAIAEGVSLILPYSHNGPVLSEMHALTGFEAAIIDTEKALPLEVKILKPERRSQPHVKSPPKIPVDIDRPWLKMFTGGSTGTPKISTKTLRNLFAEAFFLAETHAISETDRLMATVPVYHIYGLLFSVLVPLVASASVVNEIHTFPHEIVSAVNNHAATVLISIPPHYRALYNHTTEKQSLRLAFSSAGPLDQKDNENFYRTTGVPLYEIYGSTETGGIAARCRAKGEQAFTPFAPVDWKVVSERLGVRSDFLSPDIEKNTEGFYITGDRVASENNQTFVLQGRSDGIIKVGGKRVDLGDVCEKIKAIPGVRDAYLFAKPGKRIRENEIVALIEGDMDKTQLRISLAKNLVPYAQPRRIKVVDKIPTTQAGKYDQQAIVQIMRNR